MQRKIILFQENTIPKKVHGLLPRTYQILEYIQSEVYGSLYVTMRFVKEVLYFVIVSCGFCVLTLEVTSTVVATRG